MGKIFASREVCNLIICDYKTKNPILNCDYANTTTTSVTGEPVYAYGGQGHPKRVTFYGEKGGTIAIETQMRSAELYGILTGAALETSANFIKRAELAAADGVITLSGAPVAGSVNVFALNDDCGTPLNATVSGSTVTVTDSASSNDTYIVYYIENLTEGVKKFNVKSTTFPKAVTIYAETFQKAEDDTIVPYKMIVYKATPQVNFEMAFSNSGDPAALTLTFDMLADENDNLMDMILIEE